MDSLAQQIIEHQVATLAKHLEDQVDREIHRLDNLGEEDIDAIRQKRAVELRKKQEKAKEWLARGHGEYREISTEKEFFDEMKGEERMVCHFFRENWPCKVRGLYWFENSIWDAGGGTRGRCGRRGPVRDVCVTTNDGGPCCKAL